MAAQLLRGLEIGKPRGEGGGEVDQGHCLLNIYWVRICKLAIRFDTAACCCR